MAKIADTKFVKVIISKRLDNVEIVDAGTRAVESVKQGGLIVKDGKVINQIFTIKLDREVELPENFVEYIKGRKAFKKTAKGFSLTPIYTVEKV